jgi:predicted metalloprotease with PDZ domain
MAAMHRPHEPLPQPLPQPAPIEEPRDVDYPGVVRIEVDATDIARRIFSVREVIPVRPGPLTLLYPKWLPGYHSPQAPIELLAGLTIEADGERLEWTRHPVEVSAFGCDVPDGVHEITAEFQFLSPTAESQGQLVVGAELLDLQWNGVVLYPAGHFARRITVEPTLTLPPEWQFACALDVAERDGSRTRFAPLKLDRLVDSPLFAGRHFRRFDLDESGSVGLNVFADEPKLLDATDDQIEPHRELVRQADALFGARPFDRFEVLLALTDDLGAIGVEHHRSCEAVSIPGYFAEWDDTFVRRDTIPHEYVHAWNGKHRRGADSWSPCFHQPIRNSLMWVYEGQTKYWDRVLSARSGLWEAEHARGAFADMAALIEATPGTTWRPLADTTRDPIIASRSPLPWPSWQRSEDYYTEGALIWLDVDTMIREASGDIRSLDDFARAFFAPRSYDGWTSTYTMDDVVAALDAIVPHDWRGYLDARLQATGDGAPLAGLERGGYRLVFRDTPTAYQANKESVCEKSNLMFSVGLTVTHEGEIEEVLWGGPAFDAGLTAGSTILEVDGAEFSPARFKDAVARSRQKRGIVLKIKNGSRTGQFSIDYEAGHRFPHLEPIPGPRARLDEILSPRSSA